MWTNAQIQQWLDASSAHCALLLTSDTDGKALVQSMDGGEKRIPCRKTPDEKSALRRMGDLYRKTAVPLNQKITVAFADNLPHAAFLAGQIGTDVHFAPLDPALGTLALLYSGSLRTAPPV